ncbi:MAG: HEPN domain-containing protein [Rhodanobacteraceae bacterium]
MPISNPPPHLKELLSNVGETASLLDIHNAVGGTGPGRRRGIEVLNKSAIVLVVACWEAYVEDLAKISLEFMIKHAADHKAFPEVVLERVASKNNGLKAWTLAGEGWKQALSDNLTEVLARTTGTLNTPRAAQVDELFAKTIGRKEISKTWKWSGRTSAQAVSALDSLVTLRCSIAHRVKNSTSVRKQDVLNAFDLVGRLSIRSNNEVRTFIHSRVGLYPWDEMTYMSTA